MPAVKLSIAIPDVADYLALGLDRIDWNRSETLETGPFYLLTGASASTASLTGTNAAPFNLNGLDFEVYVKETLYTISFTGPDPYAIADVLTFCNAALTGVAVATDDGTGKLKITTVDTGTDATLEIGDGTANTALGFTEGQHTWGLDAYPILSVGTTTYTYYDQSGVSGFWYRYRFISSTTGDYTDWLDIKQATDAMVIDLSEVCLCWLKLADLDGTALENIQVLFTNTTSTESVALSGSTYGIVGTRVSAVTDSNGYAEIYLPRGMVIDFSIEGTGLIRRITVPDQDSVNLLDSSLSTGDIFEVQTFDIPGAIRRTI